MEIINHAGTSVSEWESVPRMMSEKFVKVFKQACWDEPKSTTCKDWRTKDSGGAHLMLELKFTELMILSASTLLRYNRTFEVFAENIELAANRTMDHYMVFQRYRLDFSSSENGVTKGSLKCGGWWPNQYCSTNPSRDELLGKDVCYHERHSCKGTEYSRCKEQMQSWLDTCHSNYLTSIRHNLQQKIGVEVSAMRRAAWSLRRGEAAVRQARRRRRSR